jgi:hypothetical protein
VEANSTGGQGSRRAVAPSDDDDNFRLQKLYDESDDQRVKKVLCVTMLNRTCPTPRQSTILL